MDEWYMHLNHQRIGYWRKEEVKKKCHRFEKAMTKAKSQNAHVRSSDVFFFF
jgi:uncharacterized protein YacL (UPF0231 family)